MAGNVITITMAGQEYRPQADSFSLQDRIEERTVASFAVEDPQGEKEFKKGQPVEIKINGVLVFGGVVDKANYKVLDNDKYKRHEITCINYHYSIDKRVVAAAYVKTKAGDIVRDKSGQRTLGTILGEEGIEVGENIDDGPELEEAIFNYVPGSQALNALAERAGMWWRIDANRELYFMERQKYDAPWAATAADMLNNSIVVENSASKYRNQQIIKGPMDLTSPQTEIVYGDGEQRTFTVGYPIAKVPEVAVSVNGGAWQQQTVGIKGVEKDKQWYWNGGEPTITQETNDTPLGEDDRIRITYQGEFPILIVSRNNAAILDRQTVEETGTGIVEDVRNEPQQSTREAAFQLAAQLLEKYSVIGRMLKFTTMRSGLQPGQLFPVYLPEYSLVTAENDSIEMLIESVTTRDVRGGLIFYDIIAVEGPEMGSWTKVFEEIIKRGELKIREGVGISEVVILPYTFEKDWTAQETPNIFRELYPADSLSPSATLFPAFEPAHRVGYLAWYNNGTELGRKAVTQQTGIETNEIFSLTYLEAGEALGMITSFGWVGGIAATTAAGTGIRVDKQALPGGPAEKTVLEAWQIEKTDRKWSA